MTKTEWLHAKQFELCHFCNQLELRDNMLPQFRIGSAEFVYFHPDCYAQATPDQLVSSASGCKI